MTEREHAVKYPSYYVDGDGRGGWGARGLVEYSYANPYWTTDK